MRLVLLLATAVACSGQPGDLRQLVRDSLRFVEDDPSERLDFSWRVERKQFDSGGKLTERNVFVGEKVTVNGVPVRRLLEKNGKKLTDKEVKEQEAKIAEAVAKAKERREESNDWVKEVGEALDFKLVGEEAVNSRQTWVLACSPRPEYSARNMRARVFEKMNGKLWIDQADRQMVRAEAETFDTVNIGFGILGRVEKGTKFNLVRSRLPDGVWVLDSQSIRFGARMLMLKWVGNEINMRHWNYRRKSS